MFKNSTLDQAMVYMIILIAGFPLLAIYSNSWGKLFGILLGVSGIIVLAFGLILFLKKWEARNKADYRLAPFYIELFIFYSLAYTFASVASPDGGFISGLHPILETGKTYKDASLLAVYYQMPYLFFDSIYYSVMIMTTLGDGSIQPNNILKMVVISHVGFTFYITVFGVAEYFSNQSSKELKKELESLKRELLNARQEKYSPLIEEKNNEQVASISKRLYISFKGLITGRYV